LTNKAYHDIIKSKNRKFIIEKDGDREAIGNTITSWFDGYDAAFAGVGNSGVMIYNLNGLVWPLILDIEYKNEKTNIWSNFFKKWSA